MNTMQAFMMGQKNQGKERMVFDWVKAAEIIKERKPKGAYAGLKDDLEYTSGVIWRGGIVMDDDCYLASTWATPLLIIYDDEDQEDIECYRMESETPGWNEKTLWPDEARAIVEILTTMEDKRLEGMVD